MNTFDVDWSPTVNLGHSKINGNKFKDAQDRAQREISRKRKCEEEFEAQMMEQESLELDSLVTNETENIKVSDKETETEHQGDLLFDFFDEGYFIKKYATILVYQIKKYCLVGDTPSWFEKRVLLEILPCYFRLNLGYQDLAYRLGVNKYAVTKI